MGASKSVSRETGGLFTDEDFQKLSNDPFNLSGERDIQKAFDFEDFSKALSKQRVKEKTTSTNLAKIEESETVIAYPRTCGFAWSNRGFLVTYSFQKYDHSKL